MAYSFNPNKVDAFRAERGEGVKDLAELLGISPKQTYLKLNGTVDFKTKELDLILNHYKKTPNMLFEKHRIDT